ncbi:hypothetical protein FN846DRAFT_974705 [Sphaerosporella brunnea]|uniref:Nicotinamide-nucleotide adenylyltransferase n=1 Tax=Sphaerosporella brunnea TaxID=1250544 RepID=A0A5J5EG33_9PEZI|nr:hypothetical protein FN846DRAFT_974695 [Sphaerosporella brunnea]KAA8894333.1 hypothetical protein FN846DRAFT_974705 [Sphaerosporella brunnea]
MTGITTAPSTPTMEGYAFPQHRLQPTLSDPSKTPLVLVACGSFSPITHMHLRMFEMALDHVRHNLSDKYEVVGGYMSPVSDRYNKAGLASAAHRIRMCELACDQTSDWIMVDPWEAIQSEYQPTAVVLDHIQHEVNDVIGGIAPYPGAPRNEYRKAHVSLLCGSDLLQTMSQPGLWSLPDLDHILSSYGAFVVERSGSAVDTALQQLKEINKDWAANIHVIRQLIANDISSTGVRQILRQGMSVHYLIPACVIQYIREHGLYSDDQGRERRSTSMPPLSRKGVQEHEMNKIEIC